MRGVTTCSDPAGICCAARPSDTDPRPYTCTKCYLFMDGLHLRSAIDTALREIKRSRGTPRLALIGVERILTNAIEVGK